MVLKKKWSALLVVITTILLLAACGDKESTGDVPPQDGPQDGSADDFMLISEGFEEYSVWIETSDTPDRNSSVRGVYVFENGEVTYFGNILDGNRLKLEEINDLTDDEIIQHAKDKATWTTYGKYTPNIILDNLGQSTQEIEVFLESGINERTHVLKAIAEENYYDGKDYYELSEKYPEFDSYLSAVIEGKEVLPSKETTKIEIKGEEVIYTSPMEDGKSLISLNPTVIHQKIFDTTYSGLKIGDYVSLLTRVEDSFVGFRMDSPENKSDNVTIEGK